MKKHKKKKVKQTKKKNKSERKKNIFNKIVPNAK